MMYRISDVCRVSFKEMTISNIITKKTYKCSECIVQALSFFRGRLFSLSEFEKYCMGITPSSNLRDIVSHLVNNRILVVEEEDETFCIIPHPFPLIISEEHFANISEIFNNIVVVGFPYGKGNSISTKTDEFPFKIRTFCRNTNVSGVVRDFTHYPERIRIIDIGDLYIYDLEEPNITLNKINKVVSQLASQNNKLLSLGGDHSVTLPIIEALSKYYQNMTVIQLDAHTDVYSSQIHTAYMNKGYTYIHHGNFMTKIKTSCSIDKIITYGIRGNNNLFVKKNPDSKTENYSSINQLILRIKKIPKSSFVYLTIDIDFFDSVLAPGTATPEICGASYMDFCKIIDKLKGLNLIGVDLTEVNPTLDYSSKTMQLSFRIIVDSLKLLCYGV